METIDNIRPLAPAPSSTSIDKQRPHRKLPDDRPARRPRRPREEAQEGPDTSPPKIDEYA